MLLFFDFQRLYYYLQKPLGLRRQHGETSDEANDQREGARLHEQTQEVGVQGEAEGQAIREGGEEGQGAVSHSFIHHI